MYSACKNSEKNEKRKACKDLFNFASLALSPQTQTRYKNKLLHNAKTGHASTARPVIIEIYFLT